MNLRGRKHPRKVAVKTSQRVTSEFPINDAANQSSLSQRPMASTEMSRLCRDSMPANRAARARMSSVSDTQEAWRTIRAEARAANLAMEARRRS